MARLGVDGTVMLVGSVLEELKGARHDGNARGASISSLGAAGPRELDWGWGARGGASNSPDIAIEPKVKLWFHERRKRNASRRIRANLL